MMRYGGMKTIRKITAVIIFVLITLLFLDFTGTVHLWFGWLAKIQLVPAILAVNMVVLVIMILLTLIFGRLYCSVICPLGILQDGISHISGKRKGKKNRFRYSKAISWMRYGVLVLFIVGFIAGTSIIVSLLDPYAGYGRIASNLFAPLYRLGNNLLAVLAETVDSYAFYPTDIWVKSWITLGIAVITVITIGILSWRNGRTYCNTICPVGTILGFLSQFSLFRLTFDVQKCNHCKACERGCKSSCIDAKTMTVDQSRCVTCFNCIERCKSGAMKYAPVQIGKKKQIQEAVLVENTLNEDNNKSFSRRNLLALLGTIAVTNTLKAQQLQVDGGLAEIEDKKVPDRKTPVIPPGAESLRNMNTHCTACQLCVSSCPNNILSPSQKLLTFMQPEMTFEAGYCRPECTECSQVCPNDAIKLVTAAQKTAISIGTATWIKDNCLVNTDNVRCTSCERHCPTGAITRIAIDPEDEKSLKIPVVDKELCIGCGACEHYCPARPFSAIFVEGNLRHHAV